MGESAVKESLQLVDYVSNLDADILCFQEFYNDSNSIYFNTLKGFEKEGYNHFSDGYVLGINKAKFGVTTLSKFPIVNQGIIEFGKYSRHNRGIFTDVAIRGDTIRILNIHLQSLAIKKGDLAYEKLKETVQKFKWTQHRKEFQVKNTLKVVDPVSDKMILCGDLNTTPYEPIYKLLNDQFSNGFEKKGNGFGYTLNKRFLRFLRIDNIFYGPSIKVNSFEVIDSVGYSDHFPIQSYFEIVGE